VKVHGQPLAARKIYRLYSVVIAGQFVDDTLGSIRAGIVENQNFELIEEFFGYNQKI
jgi:hypothetical protein